MDKKICLITGANSGIGKEAAILIAQQDYKVIIACRNPEKGNKALLDIKQRSGKDSVELKIVDISLRLGTTNAQGKDENALLPYYAQIGLKVRFEKNEA